MMQKLSTDLETGRGSWDEGRKRLGRWCYCRTLNAE